MSLLAATVVGGITAIGTLVIGARLPESVKKFLLDNHAIVDISMLMFMLWKFGHSEFGASAATMACIFITIGCEAAKRRHHAKRRNQNNSGM